MLYVTLKYCQWISLKNISKIGFTPPSVQFLFIFGSFMPDAKQNIVLVPVCCHFSFSAFHLFPAVCCCENGAVSKHRSTQMHTLQPETHTVWSMIVLCRQWENNLTPCRISASYKLFLWTLICLIWSFLLIFACCQFLRPPVLDFFCSLSSSLVHLIVAHLPFLSFSIVSSFCSSSVAYYSVLLAVCLPLHLNWIKWIGISLNRSSFAGKHGEWLNVTRAFFTCITKMQDTQAICVSG